MASLVPLVSKERQEIRALMVVLDLLVTWVPLDRLVNRDQKEIKEYKVRRVHLVSLDLWDQLVSLETLEQVVFLVVKENKAKLDQLVGLAHEDQMDHVVPLEHLERQAHEVHLGQVAVPEHREIPE